MKRTPAVAPVIEPGAPTGLGTWFDRCLALRDRWLASPVFQRRATAFAPTRWLARRRAGQLFDLVAGFVYSQALTAAVRLRLFEVLAEAPQPAEALAERLALPLDSMRRLLDALVALRLVERRTHDRYGLGPLGAPMVGNAALIAMVEHHAALYQDLADPVRLLRAAPADRRSTALSGYWAYDAAGQVGAPPLQAGAANTTSTTASLAGSPDASATALADSADSVAALVEPRRAPADFRLLRSGHEHLQQRTRPPPPANCQHRPPRRSRPTRA